MVTNLNVVLPMSFLALHGDVAMDLLIRVEGNSAGPVGGDAETGPSEITGKESFRKGLHQLLDLFFRQNSVLFFRFRFRVDRLVQLLGGKRDEVLHLGLHHLPAALGHRHFGVFRRAVVVVVVRLILDVGNFRIGNGIGNFGRTRRTGGRLVDHKLVDNVDADRLPRLTRNHRRRRRRARLKLPDMNEALCAERPGLGIHFWFRYWLRFWIRL